MRRFLVLLNSLSWSVAIIASADDFSSTQLDLFEKQVRPLLLEHCAECHSPENREGGLNLATRESLLKGGDSGPALVPRNASGSLLVQAIEYLDEPKMPPSGKLPAEKIGLLRSWIESGAAWPKDSPLATGVEASRTFQVTEKQRRWWAFQPLRDVEPPAVRESGWPLNDLDRFILSKLESKGLAPAPAADRITWLRRATLDVTGLPPTPEEVTAFVSDTTDRGFETVVDRLLDSSAYGARLARHWLDVVRYADYHDFNPAARVASCESTEAWRYRDWVVDAFNRDLPYDQFIVHQIAGDHLASPDGKEIYPDGLSATTFLSNGVWDRGDADKEKIVSDIVDDNIGVIGKAFLGLTLDCARCHDHKFDPISTEDYYGLAGIFYSSHILQDLGTKGGEYTVNRVPLVGKTALAKRAEQEMQLAAATAMLDDLDRQHRFKELTAGGRPLVPVVFRSRAGATAIIAEDARISVRGTLSKDTYGIEAVIPDSLRSRYLRLEALPDASLPAGGPGSASDGRFVVGRFAASFVHPDGQVESTPIKFVSAQADSGQPGCAAQSALDDDRKAGWAFALQCGKAQVVAFEIAPDTFVPPGSRLRITIEQQSSDAHALGTLRLSVAETLATSPPPDTAKRLELIALRDGLRQRVAIPIPLAMAVTDGGTPGGLFPGIQDVPIHIRGSYAKLGAVVPRRVPQFFAGEKQPTIGQGSGRSELAAWIASSEHPLTARVIVNRVWSWHFGEGLVRTPNNFGLLSEPPTHPELLDWLVARFVEDGWSLKKLHRRIMLSATYRQSSKIPRETFDQDPENRLAGRFTARRLEAEAIRDAILTVSGQLDLTAGGPADVDFTIRRRSLYVQTARWQRDSYANLFDAANPDASTEKRVVSTVAPQALLLLNHPWMHDQARHLAERLMREVPTAEAGRIRRAYQLLFSRRPTTAELAIAQAIVAQGDPSIPNSGLIDLAHVLLCSNEFVYID